jgi:hypothetical protein
MVLSTYLMMTAASLAVVRIVGLPYSTPRVFAAGLVFQGDRNAALFRDAAAAGRS